MQWDFSFFWGWRRHSSYRGRFQNSRPGQRHCRELDPLLNEFFERSHVTACRPDLQLRVAGRAQLQQERFIASILHLEVRDDLRMAAVEALGDTENGGKGPDGSPQRW